MNRVVPAINRHWWEYRETLLAVMDYGIETGEFVTAIDASRFVEKPYRYSALHEAWEEDQAKQGELQDEARAIL